MKPQFFSGYKKKKEISDVWKWSMYTYRLVWSASEEVRPLHKLSISSINKSVYVSVVRKYSKSFCMFLKIMTIRLAFSSIGILKKIYICSRLVKLNKCWLIYLLLSFAYKWWQNVSNWKREKIGTRFSS